MRHHPTDVLALVLAASFVPWAATAGQPPVNLILDLHADPLPQGVPAAQKVAVYERQLANATWVLDRVEPFGVEVSFLSCGELMEMVADRGPDGTGAALLRRIWENGGQVGSHSHAEYRRGPGDWPSFPSSASYDQSLRSWQDNVDAVNRALEVALGVPAPEPLERVNCVKGAHLPKTEDEYRDLMLHFGLQVRQGGPEEDYYALFNHYIWNPFRPAADNPMAEDLGGPFVVSPQGAVIGLDQVHHGVRQDMTAPAVKRLFIQAYLNWRYQDRQGLPAKVWSFGWGSHTQDYDPGDPSGPALLEVVRWLSEGFVGRLEPTGSVVAHWATQRSSAEEYFAWEDANPGVPSFGSNATGDWADYPYLRPVAVWLWGARHVADLHLDPRVTAWHLRRGTRDLAVAFSDAGPVEVDLSAVVGPRCRAIGAETGAPLPCVPHRLTVADEPVIVSELPITTALPAVAE